MPRSGTDNYLLLLYAGNSYDSAKLAEELAQTGVVDAYTLRQRLIGSGLTQLAKGAQSKLQPLLNILQRHKIPAWLVAVKPATIQVNKVNAITITAEKLSFTTAAGVVPMDTATAIIAVVADISGQLAEKQVKRLLVRNTYGGSAPTPLSNAELRQQIFRCEPVINLYWRDENGRVSTALRIMPGSFDHRQLGDKASLSRNGNLAALLDCIEERADNIYIDYHFGLSFLPACGNLKSGDDFDRNHNLRVLDRYGELLLATIPVSDDSRQGYRPGAVINKVVPNATIGIDRGVSGENSAEDTTATTTAAPPPQAEALPAPPSWVEDNKIHHIRINPLKLVAIAIAGAFAALLGMGGNLSELAWHYCIHSGAAPALASLVSLGAALHFWRLKRRIENTPTSKARSVAMGMVEITGTARRAYALISPATHVPCVYYRYQRYRRSGLDNKWKLVASRDSGPVPFVLEDETGRISIDPRHATITTGALSSSDGGDGALLGRAGDERWHEEIIAEGSQLYILGFARPATKGEDKLSERVTKKLRDLKSDRDRLMQYDANNDGQIDAAEWEQARHDMEQQALQDKLDATKERRRPQLVIGAPPQKRLPFIIAEASSEEELTNKFAWYIPPLTVGGIALFAWALASAARFFNL